MLVILFYVVWICFTFVYVYGLFIDFVCLMDSWCGFGVLVDELTHWCCELFVLLFGLIDG